VGLAAFAGMQLYQAALVGFFFQVGLVAYDTMREKYGDETVVGIDHNRHQVEVLVAGGRRVILADTSDQEFWRQIRLNDISLFVEVLFKFTFEPEQSAA
jgi:hypothetical protein